MKAMNATNGKEIADTIVVTETMFSRMKGLLGRASLPSGEGLLITPCMGIHTFGMRFPIDVVFLNREDRIVAVRKNMLPNRMSRIYPSASSVLELPAGTLDVCGAVPGDVIAIA